MRALRVGILIVGLVLVGTACVKPDFSAEQVGKIEEGMNKADVKLKLGPPDSKSEDTWVYSPSEGPYTRIEIMFDGSERVTLVDKTPR